MIQLIVIDDEPAVLDFIELSLGREDLQITRFTDPEAAWTRIRATRPEIVMVDYHMPGTSGLELLTRIAEWDPAIEVVMLTSDVSTDQVVLAIQQGASDFIAKPMSPAALRGRLEPILQSAAQRRRANTLEGELLQSANFHGIVGHSAPMLQVFALVRRMAPHFQTVLISGPTGTGKELAARALHRLSTVKDKPFVVCNCAAIVETLFESELFGHVRGSFTGATGDRAGLFEAADGGVLFLDEIGEVPLRMQAKFLRALQNGEVQRVGSSVVRKVNVRVVAATNRDLRTMVNEKEFREDLYYRLSGLEVRMPPLAQHKEDLILLERHFIQQFSQKMGREIQGISRRGQVLMSRYPWPGNVRELENVLCYACTMAQSDLIQVQDLPDKIRTGDSGAGNRSRMSLDDVVLEHAHFVYEQTGKNKLATAGILGISRATLYRYLGESSAASS